MFLACTACVFCEYTVLVAAWRHVCPDLAGESWKEGQRVTAFSQGNQGHKQQEPRELFISHAWSQRLPQTQLRTVVSSSWVEGARWGFHLLGLASVFLAAYTVLE